MEIIQEGQMKLNNSFSMPLTYLNSLKSIILSIVKIQIYIIDILVSIFREIYINSTEKLSSK